VIIPFLAAGLRYIFGGIFTAITPNQFPGDFATIFSFLLVNCTLMALFFVGVFRLCQHYVGRSKTGYLYSMLGVFAVLTCRWTLVISGSALVDSLLLCAIILLLLGIIKNNLPLLIAAIYLGPWAKESFIFFVPLILFVPKRYYLNLAIHLLISGVLIFTFRYAYDSMSGIDPLESLSRDTAHFNRIGDSLERLVSIHGLYELLSIGGVWNIFIAVILLSQKGRSLLKPTCTLFWLVFIALIIIQALLSFELARMFYMATPLMAIAVAITFKYLYEGAGLQLQEEH